MMAEPHDVPIPSCSTTVADSATVSDSATVATSVLQPTRHFAVQSRLRVGDRIQYACFVPTFTGTSTLPLGGDGLFTVDRLLPYTWLGFYPGEVTKNMDAARQVHTMGCEECNAYIIADSTFKSGLHMINEAGEDGAGANVWYVKLRCGYVLFFVGREVQAGDELLTCYSRSFTRDYPTAAKCMDPRCASSANGELHRLGSEMRDEWRQPLLDRMPSAVKLPPRVRRAELFRFRHL